MIVTRANLNYRSWEKNMEDITFADLNISMDVICQADYVVFVENRQAKVLKSRR